MRADSSGPDYFSKNRLIPSTGNEPRLVSDSLGMDYVLEKNSITVGRDEGCDLRIDDAMVSRMHARIFREGDDWYVVDTNSVNGVSINGRRIVEGQRYVLRPNDEIMFATHETVRFVRREGASPVTKRASGDTSVLPNTPPPPVDGYRDAYEQPKAPPAYAQPKAPPAYAQPQAPSAFEQPKAAAGVPLQTPPEVVKKKRHALLIAVIAAAVIIIGAAAFFVLRPKTESVQTERLAYTVSYVSRLGAETAVEVYDENGVQAESVELDESGRAASAVIPGDGGAYKECTFDGDAVETVTAYDAAGIKLSECAYEDSKWCESKYAADGTLVSTAEYDYDGGLLSFAALNDEGFWVSDIYSGSSVTSREYRMNGVLTKTEFLDAGGAVESFRLYAYNDGGELTSEEYYDADGALTRTYLYTYGKNGSVTEKTVVVAHIIFNLTGETHEIDGWTPDTLAPEEAIVRCRSFDFLLEYSQADEAILGEQLLYVCDGSGVWTQAATVNCTRLNEFFSVHVEFDEPTAVQSICFISATPTDQQICWSFSVENVTMIVD